MQRIAQTLVLVGAWSLTGLAAAEAFRGYAEVLNVQPIVETLYEPVTRQVCSDPDPSVRVFSELATTIGEDIRRQKRLWQAKVSCTTVAESRARERVTAYRVTYRYRGYTSTTRLSYDPGERMPVNVSLSPLP